MENQFLDHDSQALNEMSGFSSIDKDYLFTAAKWSRFLGIVGFVMTGFIVIAALFMFTMGSALSSLPSSENSINPYGGLMRGFGGMIGGFYLLMGVFYFFMSLYMYNFGTKTKSAITNNDSIAMTEGLKNLKSFFTFLGILAVVLLCIYALLIVIGIGAAMMVRR